MKHSDIDHTGLTGVGGSGGGEWDAAPASPNANDDEFDTTTASGVPAGWTGLGTADHICEDTDAPSALHIRATAVTGGNNQGVYKAWTPTNGDTVTAKISDGFTMHTGIFGLFLGAATPGIMAMVGLYGNSATTRRIQVQRYTTPTTWNAYTEQMFDATNEPAWDVSMPLYLRITYNTSTSLTFSVSQGGRLYVPVQSAYNPSMTTGSFGLFVDSNHASWKGEAFFEWVRVNWTPGS